MKFMKMKYYGPHDLVNPYTVITVTHDSPTQEFFQTLSTLAR